MFISQAQAAAAPWYFENVQNAATGGGDFVASAGVYDIMEKLKLYFAAGVKSCWFVEPFVCSVTVFSSVEQAKTFTEGEVIDNMFNIRININDIFVWHHVMHIFFFH